LKKKKAIFIFFKEKVNKCSFHLALFFLKIADLFLAKKERKHKNLKPFFAFK
jgi:hypothetical protein